MLGLLWLGSGCQTAPRASPYAERPFQFHRDTFSYANELAWEYQIDPATGRMEHRPGSTPKSYVHRCFPMVRAARLLFQCARFEPDRPKADESFYRRRVHEILDRNARAPSQPPVVIPGYADLFSFSQDWAELLKKETGGSWRSYFQRGNWRMIFPFTEAHQQRMATQLVASLRRDRPPIVHLVTFPHLTLNHAVLLFGFEERGKTIDFLCYDPNDPVQPAHLLFDSDAGEFSFPENHYFPGGRVHVYEVFHAWNY